MGIHKPHPNEQIQRAICDKWVARLGFGFHPDTREYLPALSAEDQAEYDADMDELFSYSGDPYEHAVKAIHAWDDAHKLPPCKFAFDDSPTYEGFSHGSTWNGFDNVAVTKETLDKIIADFNDPETTEQFREITPMENGLYSLGWGFSTSIVEG